MRRKLILATLLLSFAGNSAWAQVFPKRWSSKPPPAVQIKQGHPLAIGLVSVYVLSEGGGLQAVDLRRQVLSPITFGGTDNWAINSGGLGLSFDDLTSEVVVSDTDNVIATKTNSSVFAAVQSLRAFPVDGAPIWGERSGSTAIWKFQGGDAANQALQLAHRDDANNLTFVNANTNFENDGLVHQVGVTKAGTAIKFYFDGRDDGGGTLTGNDTLTVSKVRVGNDAFDTGEVFEGIIYLVYVWARTLSPAEMAQVTIDPFAFFVAPRRLWPSPLPAGGIGITGPIVITGPIKITDE